MNTIKGRIVVDGFIEVEVSNNVFVMYDLPLKGEDVEDIVRTHAKFDHAVVDVTPWEDIYYVDLHGLERKAPKRSPRREVYKYSLRGLEVSPESVQYINDLLKPW